MPVVIGRQEIALHEGEDGRVARLRCGHGLVSVVFGVQPKRSVAVLDWLVRQAC